MTKLKTILIIILIMTLNSCDNKSIKSETEDYTLEIKKAPDVLRDFTNHIQTEPLNINAEKLNLKNIFAILMKTDTSKINLKIDRKKNEYYSLLIEQKKEDKSINETIMNEILDKWNLQMNVSKSKTYEIEIKDTIRYNNFISNTDNKTSTITRSKDSIIINNGNLKEITEILNSEFSATVIFNNESKRIDYKWKKSTFEKLKIQLQQDLGILFLDSKNDKSVFTIENN